MAEMLRPAADEMAEAADSYETQRAGVGHRFLHQIGSTAARIDRFPWLGAPWSARGAEVRRIAIKGFPYYLVYVTEPAVIIVAVAHMKRRPGYWSDWLPPR